MKLVYKLQAEDYKFDFPVSYLPVSKPRWWGWARGHGAGSGRACRVGRWPEHPGVWPRRHHTLEFDQLLCSQR